MASTKVVLPGDIIDTRREEDTTQQEPIVEDEATVIRLGPGLIQASEAVTAVTAGVLHSNSDTNRWWVAGNKRRYVAAVGEPVVGVVVARHGEGYR
ncbi:exosome non-catalytic core subunit rrp40, partial [Coemansia sp. RSA 2530]